MSREFLSCDWGTSSFRIRWIENGHLVREYRDDTGCKTLFEEGLASGDKSPERRAALYEAFLKQTMDGWGVYSSRVGHPMPLVISGMASSSIGWRELSYASVPLNLDGSNLRFETISWDQPGWIGNTYLISGVATEDEIMRGEETEAIGLLSGSANVESCILVL